MKSWLQHLKGQERNFGFVAIIVVIVLVVLALTNTNNNTEQVSLSEVVGQVEKGNIEEVIVDGNKITAVPREEGASRLVTYREDSGVSITEYGINPDQVKVTTKDPTDQSQLLNLLLISFLPIIVIIAFFYFMMRQAQGQSNQAMGFGKSKARLYGNEQTKVTFTDIAGAEESKEELQEVVEFLKTPKKFSDIGARIPKGVLMIGAPGTGKTMVARAVAGEADAPFFSISGSEFVEMFVGVGASRVRDLFMKAKKNAPCIIFIDEIDAVGRRRGAGHGGGHDEREQTLNQILVELDGFEQDTNVIVMAATNRPDVLDPALLRPGRFDRQVQLELPDRKDRRAILGVHLEDKKVSNNLNLDALAAKTAGMSGADLSNVVNEAAISAARADRKKIINKDLDDAFEKVAIGPERKTQVMTDHEKKVTAYHESGHTLIGHLLEHADPIHKVTIISRGGAGGITWSLPTEDKVFRSLAEFKDSMAMAMGGRIAEEIVFGHQQVTNGASNDLQTATSTARDMVTKYGMSDELANQYLDSSDSSILLDRGFSQTKEYSEDTAEKVDKAVRALLEEAETRARSIIKQNKEALNQLANQLLEKETLGEEEVLAILQDAINPDPQTAQNT
ncbi:cell division protein FtsH [Candidatus Saccharibacteria bacterium QS_5_54_17]|nr:MAG: cell division protein FtsH [Candidatus Saccharibacteria bacterium QS_5_54_17]